MEMISQLQEGVSNALFAAHFNSPILDRDDGIEAVDELEKIRNIIDKAASKKARGFPPGPSFPFDVHDNV